MVNKEFYTPEIDGVVEKYGNSGFAVYSVQDNYFMSSEIAKILEELFECLQAIKPQMDGQDKVWALWIRSKRGPMSAFMDNEEYEELREAGEIKSQEELQSLRNDYYPEEINWHKTSFRIYDNNFIFGFDSKLILQLDIESKQLSGISFEGAELIDFLKWVLNDVETEIKAALNGIDAYNDFVTANLPLRKRFGRIKRMQLWQHVPEMERLDEDLGETSIKRFEIAVNAMNKDSLINDLTADKFFRYCEICYDANDYFKNKQSMSPRSKYKAMADRRDGGLISIVGDSQDAFEEWYSNKAHTGGHPWEICRGGNSTHISLILNKKADGWQLYLAGSSRARVLETARMAIALFENKIPFILAQAHEMLNMIKGTDYCGIVPEAVTPKYCHNCFPDEDKIIDFINPWHDEEIVTVIKEHATWYPLNKLELA